MLMTPTAKAVSASTMAKGREKLTGSLLYPWQYGKEYFDPNDLASVIKTFRGWVAIYAGQNARTVASVPLRLYVAKRTSTSKMLRPTRSISRKQYEYLSSKSSVANLVAKGVEIEEVTDHPFIDVITRINSFTNYYDHMTITDTSLEVAGNTFWYVPVDGNGIPYEIWNVPPQYMTVVPDKQDFIKGYMFRNGMTKIAYDESEIIHFKDANMLNPFYGLGKVVPNSDAYNIMRSMDIYQNSMFTHMGRPDGALTTDQPVPREEDRKRIIREWNNVYGGTGRAGKTAFLDNGVGYQVIGTTPREMAFTEGKPLNKEQIAEAFGFTKAMLDASSLASAEVGERLHRQNAIIPQLKLIEDKLNEKMLPRYGDPTLFVAFDNPIPPNPAEEREDRKVNMAFGITRRNEERGKLGLDQDDPRLDEFYIPGGMVPIGTVKAETQAPDKNSLDTDEEKRYIDTMAKEIADRVIETGY